MFFTHPVWCILLLVTLFNLQGTGAALVDSFDRIAYLSLFVKHFFQVLANFFRFPILFGFSQPLPSRTAFLDYHPSAPLSRTFFHPPHRFRRRRSLADFAGAFWKACLSYQIAPAKSSTFFDFQYAQKQILLDRFLIT